MNLGVKFRIYGGFAIVVALAVTLAGFAVWQLGLTQAEVARMGTIADNNARVLQLSQTFEVIQRTYLQYKAVADEAQLKQANAAEQKALSLLSAARQAETNDERLKIFTALENGIGELKTRRVALANLMTPARYYLDPISDSLGTAAFGDGAASGTFTRLNRARRSRPPTLYGYWWQLLAISQWSSRRWLHKVKVPCLVVAGSNDQVAGPSTAEILARSIPEARLLVAPDAGHLLLYSDQPHPIVPEIVAFLTAGEGAQRPRALAST